MENEGDRELLRHIALLEMKNVALLNGLKQGLKLMSSLSEVLPGLKGWPNIQVQYDELILLGERFAKESGFYGKMKEKEITA